ncbi:hypothetical protein FACS1894200_05060 [Spirochaetia bacterium]|nr:hypothetical protein FACS1894200_05060 [Spirochaetia bacterium]
MITMINTFTNEIDDTEAAVQEILEQIKSAKPLSTHSIGIVTCFADFISSGVLAALAAALPFPIVGITTLASATRGHHGEMTLVMSILTGADVEFVPACTKPLAGEEEAPIKEAWEAATKGRGDMPELILSFAPLLLNAAADFYAEVWTEIAPNVPTFGTLAVDHNLDYHESATILNGEAFKDRYVFVLCYGNVKAQFFVAGITEEKAFREKGVVTSSVGNQVKGVNGVSVAQYLKGLGLKEDENGIIEGINSFPFIMDYHDGAQQPVIRCMFAITPDGSAVCGGKVPEGATLSVGVINVDEVLTTSGLMLQKAKEAAAGGKAVLMFSCVGRFFAQGFNQTAEMEKAQSIWSGLPFHLAYSGGELCPVYDKTGLGTTNRCHNATLVICVF